MGGGGAPTARHTLDTQDGNQSPNVPVPPDSVTKPTIDGIPSMAHQSMLVQEKFYDQNDVFDLIDTNNYNNESK